MEHKKAVITQIPASSARLMFHRGDTVVFQLILKKPMSGAAFLRTELGRADVQRVERINFTEREIPILGRSWHDLEMRQVSDTRYEIRLALFEVGCFESKCWFKPTGSTEPQWADGSGNTIVKVESAENYCANTVYSLFTRQFSKDMKVNHDRALEKKFEELDEHGYTVIPPSGTFRDVIRQLDFIICKLRSRIIQLLPIHPLPNSYGRMGRYGSPFASRDYFAVEPALAEFDVKATPLEQFLELVDAVHARGARIFLDIPVNHTGWAAKLHDEHPDWYVRRPDGTFESPGAWGTVWSDLSKLDYSRPEVHHLMAKVFLFWCRKGVDGFRCDAGYMLPFEAWVYITAKVRHEYPNTVFLLEGLGGPLSTVEKLLGEGGLNWAYSEFFQNYDREQIEQYLESWCYPVSMNKGLQTHFAETHDNLRLAARSKTYAKMRTAASALLSVNGAFGITNGLEWFATERINVHGSAPLNWDAADNQVEEIRLLQTLLAIHPAFSSNARLEMIHERSSNALALMRIAEDDETAVLVLVNLDDSKEQRIKWSAEKFPASGLIDLLTGEQLNLERSEYLMKPGETRCLSADHVYYTKLRKALKLLWLFPNKILKQRRRALAAELISFFNGYGDLKNLKLDKYDDVLSEDPYRACVEIQGSALPGVAEWHDGVDQNRIVMLPEKTALLVFSHTFFRVELKNGDTTVAIAVAMPLDDGRFYTFITNLKGNAHPIILDLKLTTFCFAENQAVHSKGKIMLLSGNENATCQVAIPYHELSKEYYFGLCTTRLSGYSLVSGRWGELCGKYDAFLAANCNPDYPVDSTVMLTRCRAWAVYHGYSHELNIACQTNFVAGHNNIIAWSFSVVAGQGKTVTIKITLRMSEASDAITLAFERLSGCDYADCLDDSLPVTIIVRPDIEDRSVHEVTKAFSGPESSFPKAITQNEDGFIFDQKRGHRLQLTMEHSDFISEPEWQYMVPLPLEQSRGLESHTDLFSPGYFKFELKGNDHRILHSAVNDAELVKQPVVRKMPEQLPLEPAMRYALRHFVVKRDTRNTVIAGYPWFLDWGRDTLICLRGLIASGLVSESREIIHQFARFEHYGTLPNIIHGNDVSNRDTSDAPLWLFVAVKDFITGTGDREILNMDCGGRTLLAVLKSIVENYRSGTPNGIHMDTVSGLIFSPSHFTWMDTNYPACTARMGYPIEIQALWNNALNLMSEHDSAGDWNVLSEKVIASIEKYYRVSGKTYLSDCLHASPGQSAAQAIPDDACRPNQLFAITLNAIRNRDIGISVLRSCECLIVPGAIRSLADAPVDFAQPILHNGKLLNNPERPYWGQYIGDEDTKRKPAYHNGTAWTWPFPSFCEAMFMLEPSTKKRALALLLSGISQMRAGIPGQLPEIVDGNAPHHWRGCAAQAWGMSEMYRVYQLLTAPEKTFKENS